MTTELTLHRILKAPRGLVWDCWTKPEHLPQWFCPKPHFVTEAVIDLRPGGRFFTTMNIDGKLYPNDGSFLEVVDGERLVFTDMMLADWQPVNQPGLGFTAAISFRDHAEGTEYDVVARHRSAEAARRHEEMGFSQGWGTAADQLEALAAGLAKNQSARQIVLTRLLRADPETVWTAWSDPEVLPRWFGPKGHSCHTKSIDLREGGAWVFDMIGPDGTVYPNRHSFTLRRRPERIEFVMDDGAGNAAKTAKVELAPEEGGTRITMTLTFASLAAHDAAVDFGARELGMTTLAKLAAIVEA
jgi:uncharacterized protein YndB with AHSA1/START domain